MTDKQKSCFNCRHLRKYTADGGWWLNVCEGEQPQEDEEGVFYVPTINTGTFNPALCVMFRQKDTGKTD